MHLVVIIWIIAAIIIVALLIVIGVLVGARRRAEQDAIVERDETERLRLVAERVDIQTAIDRLDAEKSRAAARKPELDADQLASSSAAYHRESERRRSVIGGAVAPRPDAVAGSGLGADPESRPEGDATTDQGPQRP